MHRFSAFTNPAAIGELQGGHPSIWIDGKLHEQGCEWLNLEVVPSSQSPNTWVSAARALVTWLEWCAATDLDWRDATRDDVVAYRDAYLGAISPRTGETYAPATVRSRLSYILSFIGYAAQQGWLLDPAWTGERCDARQAPIDRDMRAHTRKGRASQRRLSGPYPKGSSDKVRVLGRKQLKALLEWAGPRPSERTHDSPGLARDRLVFDLGWAVGLRLVEKLYLPVYPFLAITDVNPHFLYKVEVLGKGNKRRQVDVPGWLVEDIIAYIEGDRERDLRGRGRTAREGKLLLNASTSTSRAGRPMTRAGVDKLIRRACWGAGLTERRVRTNPETGEETAEAVAMFSDHCLRHTYAVTTWHALKANGHDEEYRWKYIQHQLGHANLKTTTNTYLKHVSVWATPGLGARLNGMS